MPFADGWNTMRNVKYTKEVLFARRETEHRGSKNTNQLGSLYLNCKGTDACIQTRINASLFGYVYAEGIGFGAYLYYSNFLGSEFILPVSVTFSVFRFILFCFVFALRFVNIGEV